MQGFLKMLIVASILDVLWVMGSGAYTGLVKGGLTRWTIAPLWTIVLVSQVTLLSLLLKGDELPAVWLGALQGFTVYSVFNITSKVVFPDAQWPWSVALTDTLWGTVLYGFTAYIA